MSLIGIFFRKEGVKFEQMTMPEFLPDYVINLDYIGNYKVCSPDEHKNGDEWCDVCTLIHEHITSGVYGEDFMAVDVVANLAHKNHFDAFSTRIECQGCDDNKCILKKKHIYFGDPKKVTVNNKLMSYYTFIELRDNE